jgi:hypothetical protein
MTKSIRELNAEFRYSFYNRIRRVHEIRGRGSRTYLLVYGLRQDMLQSLSFIVKICRDHVDNVHQPLSTEQFEKLAEITRALDAYLDDVCRMIFSNDFSDYSKLKNERKNLLVAVEDILSWQVERIQSQSDSARNSLLFLSLLLETKDIAAVTGRFAKLYYRLYKAAPGTSLILSIEDEEGG